MTPAEQAALALWIEIEPYSHEPWASNDPGFAVKRIAAAIEQARREEREACARHMDAVGQPGFATQLRARAQEE